MRLIYLYKLVIRLRNDIRQIQAVTKGNLAVCCFYTPMLCIQSSSSRCRKSSCAEAKEVGISRPQPPACDDGCCRNASSTTSPHPCPWCCYVRCRKLPRWLVQVTEGQRLGRGRRTCCGGVVSSSRCQSRQGLYVPSKPSQWCMMVHLCL